MTNSAPATALAPGQQLHGFAVRKVTPLPDIRLAAIELEHLQTGAGVLHLLADDPENMLAIAFRTPPADDTGLPHILEHTVLCGSRRYPVKDPFVELLKSSLATFLNAMTYADKTVYPCASMNEKDFFNLAGVYCDAVFHPTLDERHFRQEGHHLDFVSPGDVASPLTVKGIVYNEMKGVFSSLDGIIGREAMNSICPDNAYGLESGGAPDKIRSLTYEQFVAFHRRYYHPSNSLFFLYGNIPTEKQLAFLERECLGAFDRRAVDASIAAQPRWSEPRRRTLPYPAAESEKPEEKSAALLSFLANDLTDELTTLAMHLADLYLMDNDASPLRQALTDSGLGEDVIDYGYSAHARDTFFAVGLKGTSPAKAAEMERLVFATIARECDAGFDREKVESALHKFEIGAREISSSYPLHLMDRVFGPWQYGGDPLSGLRLNDHIATLRAKLAAEPGFLEKIVRRLIVDNPHFAALIFVPDAGLMRRQEEELAAELAETKRGLRPEELAELARAAAELEALQSAPNSPEALATLPALSPADVSPEPVDFATAETAAGGAALLVNDVFTNGLNYLALAFDISGLDEALLPYLPLYCEALGKMGAGGLDYAAMAEREAACAGGLSVTVSCSAAVGDPRACLPCVTLCANALDRKADELLVLAADRLLKCDFTDRERLRDLALQGMTRLRASLVPAGSAYAARYAARLLSPSARLAEIFSGVTQVRFFDRLAREFDAEADELVETLQRIHTQVVAGDRITASFAGAATAKTSAWLAGLSREAPASRLRAGKSDFRPELGKLEAVLCPANVAFNAAALPAPAATHPDVPALLLAAQLLRYDYLWNEIRAKRGAYGAAASFSPLNAMLTFSSYRDPCIAETFDTFAGTARYVAEELDCSPAAVDKARIACLRGIDRPVRPGEAVGTALARRLSGQTSAYRRELRSGLLAADAAEVKRVATRVLRETYASANLCSLTGKELLAGIGGKYGNRKFAASEI